ncbi:MAG: amino acid permease, partial [Oscillospiraceae bacterium]|nr:amino acid permease [Oscillospiraceae bacterium]
NATTIIYCIVYVIMSVGILKLRREKPDLERPFRVKALRGIVTMFLVVLVFAITASFATGTPMNAVASSAISAGFFIVPLLIFRRCRASWGEEVQAKLKEHADAAEAAR